MRRITIALNQTVKGKNPLTVYYAAVNAAYPTLGLTTANSKVVLVQPYGNPSDWSETITRVMKNNDPSQVFEFIHKRYDINNILNTPVFTPADLTAITNIQTSEALLAYIATKYNRAFTADDFWVSINDIKNEGGSSGKNWLMRSRYSSMFWYGEKTVWLHPAP